MESSDSRTRVHLSILTQMWTRTAGVERAQRKQSRRTLKVMELLINRVNRVMLLWGAFFCKRNPK